MAIDPKPESLTDGCTRCVMRHEDDPALLVVDGVCNHCLRYLELLPPPELPRAQMARRR